MTHAPLPPDRWARVEALFSGALERPAGERDAFLREACAGDEALRREVESLLAAAGEPWDGGMSAVQGVARDLMTSTGSTAVGSRLGPYRLEEEIGRGGMGVVYRAVRVDGNFQQTAAVKVLPGALFSPERVDRFRRERRILAGLEHPNIARILDGGATADGVPYVIMEYVEGVPLDVHVRDRALELEDRIWLFLAVCDAVNYAHRNLVVHRDLKPANILVTPDGVPKLLDFGIAKLVEGDGGDADAAASLTETRLMTPRFASPEQLLGHPAATPSDVYSLGLVLYQLLAGVHPREADTTPTALVREVLERDPPAPSAAAGDRRLEGDLDTVVLKALRRDSAERYDSVAALADDLKRFLTGRPITARRPTAGYRARKFVARNRGGVAVAGVAVLLLATQAGLFLDRLARERDVAREQAERATRTLDFMSDLFRGADPFVSANPDISALELLGRGTARLEAELAGQPEIQAEILTAVGDVYENLGALDSATAVFQRALQARESAYGPGSLEVARGLSELAGPAAQGSDFQRAESLLVRSLKLRRAGLPPNHPDLAADLSLLALVAGDVGRFEEGDSLFQEALAILDDPVEPRPELRATTLSNHGILLLDWGRLARARTQLEAALTLRRELYGERHPQVAVTLGHLARLAGDQGRLNDAEALFNDLLAWAPELVGEEGGWVTTWKEGLSTVYLDLGRNRDGLELQEEVVAERRRSQDPSLLATSLNNLANLQGNVGLLAEAEANLQESLEINRRVFGDESPAVTTGLNNLATLVWRRGDAARAAEMQTRVLELDRRQLGDEHHWVATDLTAVGDYHLWAGDLERAGGYLRQGLDLILELRGPDHTMTAHAQTSYADWLVATGRGAEADSLARKALETRLREMGPGSEDVALSRSTLGAALTLLGRWDEAEAELARAAEIMEAEMAPGDPLRARNQERLAWLRAAREGIGRDLPP
ncbi:MAG: serine/threonine-protein kinase [Longimicrobiales bacterium]|nr:serine/threonine-protein kinase [Longimicrobiales bacterium]